MSSKSSNRFGSQTYLDDYHSLGRFPKIHDDISALIQATGKTAPAMDFGACTGLLSVRLVEKLGMPLVVAIEPNLKDYARRVSNNKVHYYNMAVNRDGLAELKRLIALFEIKMLVARRVFPEIGNNDPDFIPVLAHALAESGVEDIFLEGRVFSVKSVASIPNAGKECLLLSEHYWKTREHKNCRHLAKIA